MGKQRRDGIYFLILFLILLTTGQGNAQCTSSDILEPGFKFLTSSRGCAPFTVQIQTEYLASTPGTVYYIDWGDGTSEEQYVQTGTAGVIMEHTYPNSPIECGYDIIIDASNECNPRGSVTPVETQVIVWTNDVININPKIFRVCQGFAAELQFTDNSDWNCFPRDTRENSMARWIQWVYGTADGTNRIPNITIDSIQPTSYPYNNPDPNYNPFYPATAPGQISLPIQIPVTAPADLGKEFEILLKNWNQCNPYDNDIKDGDPFNPVNGDIVNGDNSPIVTTAHVVIVPAPEPDFQTRAGDASGPLQNTFCIDDQIYFENLTPAISGADFVFSWEFYDNSAGTGNPSSTSSSANPTYSFATSGKKLVRLIVRDQNAAGNCETIIEREVFVSPLVQAAIGVTDLNDNYINAEFCQKDDESLLFNVRFHDESIGTVTSDIRWRWEFYDQNSNLTKNEPSGGGFSSSSIGPFDMQYQFEGEYLVKLIILDEVTGCTSSDSAYVKVSLNPVADFHVEDICFGNNVFFIDSSISTGTYNIIKWEYDINIDYSIDTTFTNSVSWNYDFSTPADYPVKLIVTNENGCRDSTEKIVAVKPLPEVDFTADILSGCSELEVNFLISSWNQSLPVESYQWMVNSGNGFVIDSIQSPSDLSLNGTYRKVFINAGSEDKIYEVKLIAKAENGCERESDIIYITVTPGAASGFLYTNYSPFNNNCSPLEINFTVDQQTQDLQPENYTWVISSSDSIYHEESTGTTPSFSYLFENFTNAAKDYEITLYTSLNSACTSDSTLMVKINPTPEAEFDLDTLQLDCDVFELIFIANQKGLSSYNWIMKAEGSIIFSHQGSQDSFTYIFDRTNSNINIEVSLTTKNLANCTSHTVTKNAVIPARNEFTASFIASPSEVSLPDASIQINNNSTSGEWQYHWDFGDGNTSTEAALTSYSYSEAGDFLIQLTISDGTCTSSFSQSVRVTSPPPMAEFDYDPGAGCIPLTVTFTNQSQFAQSYQWDFGDSNISTDENPVHTYTVPGIYSVKLTAYGDGNQDVVYKQNIIQVYEKPIAYFEVRPNLVYIPDMPVFTNNLSEKANRYEWDFGDGTISEEFEPKHVYTAPGQYDVTLKAYNDYCFDSLIIREAVTAKESGRVLIPNAFTPSRYGPGNMGSGENDVFLPLLANVSEFKLQIFNRWGELLFEGINKGWDGYYKGRLCAQDVYVYKLEVTFHNGDQTTKVGDVNLIR